MFNVIVFNNVLVTDTQQPLPDFESMEGVQSVKTFEENGYGVAAKLGLVPKDDPTKEIYYNSSSPASLVASLAAKEGDLVVIHHPSHITDDGNRLKWFTGLLVEGVRVMCLTTGKTYEAKERDKATATVAYTDWNIEANQIKRSGFRLP